MKCDRIFTLFNIWKSEKEGFLQSLVPYLSTPGFFPAHLSPAVVPVSDNSAFLVHLRDGGEFAACHLRSWPGQGCSNSTSLFDFLESVSAAVQDLTGADREKGLGVLPNPAQTSWQHATEMIPCLLLQSVPYSKQGFVLGGLCQVESWKSDFISLNSSVFRGYWGFCLLSAVFHFGNMIKSLKSKAPVSFGEERFVTVHVVAGGFWQRVFLSHVYDFDQVHSCYL